MLSIFTVSLHWKGTWLVQIFGFQYCQVSNKCELCGFLKNESKSDSQLDCARVLGSMMYIMECARSDITFAINELSWFTSDPNRTH